MKNILITGATGFIGGNLKDYLSNEFRVFAPTHKELELLEQKEVNLYIAKNKIDYIVHAANVGGTRKTRYDAGKTDIVFKNLLMFFNLAGQVDSKRKMIYFGTGAEYDMRYYKPKMKEDYFDKSVPIDSYGFAKYVCSKYVEDKRGIVNLRLFGVFGKYEDYTFKFISNSIVKNLLGLSIVINQNVCFDYLYIDDLAKIVVHLINKSPLYRFYNVTPGKPIDLVTIANKINEISKKPSKIIVKNVGLNNEYSADNKRIKKELGNFKFTSFDSALKELYGWYKANIDRIDKDAVIKDELIAYCRTKG